jgi:nucleotide-binding universal stress UspA family protein
MIKSILVPASSETFDDAVLETALWVAQPAAGHIELRYFCKPLPADANAAHQAGWAVGGAVAPALALVDDEIERQSRGARVTFAEICRRKGVALVDGLVRSTSVTATWHSARDDLANLVYHARHADLIVMGRPGSNNGFARSHIELVLAGSGRPVLIAPTRARPSISGTAFVCWKETPEAARAVGAALPLLADAQRVVLANVDEGVGQSELALRAVARQLARHGIDAETRLLPRNKPVPEALAAAAEAHEADLIVLGAYGHSKAREVVFGGCTRAFLDSASVPVLMMH